MGDTGGRQSRRYSYRPGPLKTMTKILATLAALVLLAGCATAPEPAPSKPKLVVFMAIDGFPKRQLVDYRDQLAPDGFRRFLDRGTWFSDAHYGYSFTVTAAGHATMLTGAYPHATGIIGNEWRDPATGEWAYCTADTTATYIGHNTKKLDGTSPKNLKVETVGDVLRKLSPNSLSRNATISSMASDEMMPVVTSSVESFSDSGGSPSRNFCST